MECFEKTPAFKGVYPKAQAGGMHAYQKRIQDNIIKESKLILPDKRLIETPKASKN